MLYYKKINVDNFELIQTELEKATINNVTDNIRFWDVPFVWFKENAPLTYEFINLRKKVPVRLCRFYLTPPYDNLQPHVDGLTTNKSPIGLNLPIIGCEDTTMDWYDSPDSNLKDGPYGFNGITASRVIDFTKLRKVDTTTIDCPTFVRTDIVHGVTNFKSTPRLVLSLRFPYTQKFGQRFEDVFTF